MRHRFFCTLFVFVAALGVSPSSIAQTPTPSPAPTPPPSDIYVATLSNQNGVLSINSPKKITDQIVYNNQPFFLPNGQGILYTSIRSGQADIYRYDIRGGLTAQVTNTPESEYSPTLMPDAKNISVVRVEADGTQRLWKFPIAGGSPSLSLENIKPVGYHWWIDKHTLALFILGGAGKPPTLQLADIRTGKAEVVAENPGRILRLIPHQNRLSFVHKVSEQEWLIKALDLKTRHISTLIRTLPGSEDYAWTPDGALLMAKDAKIFKWNPMQDKDWIEVANLTKVGLKNLTRIAVSPKGDSVAIVAR